MTAPQAFRNSCSLEISCDDHGRDCQMVVACDLRDPRTGEVATLRRVIDLQPIIARIHDGLHFHATGERVGARGMNDYRRNALPGFFRSMQPAWKPGTKAISRPQKPSPRAPDPEPTNDQDQDPGDDQSQEDSASGRLEAINHLANQATSIARRVAAAKGVDELWRDAKPYVTSGWFDSVSHFVSDTAKKYRGEITKAATAAAVGVATVYGGPIAGAAAAKLTGKMIDAAYGGDPHAAQVVANVKKIATTPGHPQQAAAANIYAAALKAAKATTTAYTVAATVSAAQAGNPQAQAAVADIHAAASQGDPAAQYASQVATLAQTKAVNNPFSLMASWGN